jgi:hypothetical protein
MRRGLAHPLHQAGSGACIDWAGHRGAGDRHVMLLHPTASTVRGAKYLNETGFITGKQHPGNILAVHAKRPSRQIKRQQ